MKMDTHSCADRQCMEIKRARSYCDFVGLIKGTYEAATIIYAQKKQ